MFKVSSQLPEGWGWKLLDSIASLDNESLGSDTPSSYSFTYIDISSVTTGRVSIPSEKMKFRDAPSRARKRVKSGDVLMATVRPNLQAFAIFNEPGSDYIASTGFAVLTPRENNSAGFIYNSLLADYVGRQIDNNTSGTNYPAIASSKVSALNIATPPPTEQHAIASILDSFDNAIRHTEQMIDKLQRVKTGLLHDLLTCGLDENGELRDPIRHPEQFKNSPLGRIPKAWDVDAVNNMCFEIIDCKNRTPPILKDGHPVIRTPNVRDGQFILENLVCTDPKSYIEWTARGKPEPGDVVITREAPYGEACIIPDDIAPPCLGQRMMMYKVDPLKVHNEFLVQMIYSQRMQQLFLGMAGGSTVGHLRVGDVRTLPVPHPLNVDEQKAIAEYTRGINSLITIERMHLSKLTRCKQGLMGDLLTGVVRVSEGAITT